MGSFNRSVVEAMPDECVFLAASYVDVAEAEADAAARAEQHDRIRAVLTNARATIDQMVSVDIEPIVRMTDHLQRAASKRRRETS